MSDTLIIDDSNVDIHIRENSQLCGCLPRRASDKVLTCASSAQVDLLEWVDIPDAIADHERNESTLYHMWLDSKIGTLNQGQLGYCWFFSGTYCLMLEKELQKLPYQHLSPSSGAAPITNYQNKGWYIEDCLKWMCDTGVSTTEFVPETTCNQRDFKPGWKESAAQNKVVQWRDITPNQTDPNDGTNLTARAQISMLLSNHPLAVALNWWSHAICELRVIDSDPKLKANNYLRYGRGALQSWGPSYGVNGYFELSGSKGNGDSAYAIEQTSFAE